MHPLDDLFDSTRQQKTCCCIPCISCVLGESVQRERERERERESTSKRLRGRESRQSERETVCQGVSVRESNRARERERLVELSKLNLKVLDRCCACCRELGVRLMKRNCSIQKVRDARAWIERCNANGNKGPHSSLGVLDEPALHSQPSNRINQSNQSLELCVCVCARTLAQQIT